MNLGGLPCARGGFFLQFTVLLIYQVRYFTHIGVAFGCSIATQSNPAIPGGVSRDFEKVKDILPSFVSFYCVKLWPRGLAEISLSITNSGYLFGLHKSIFFLPLYFRQRAVM